MHRCQGEQTARPRYEVAGVLKQFLGKYKEKHPIGAHQQRVLNALFRCQTKDSGWHRRKCEVCGYTDYRYNGCRNRHCPKCQWGRQQTWIGKLKGLLLRVGYYQVVFTIPEMLNGLMRSNEKSMYDLLFEASSETLETFSKDERYLGAEMGIVGVLHTWGQTLNYHVHTHYLVTSGGLTKRGTWKWAKGGGNYLFPVKAMSRVFRGKYIGKLEKMYEEGKLEFYGESEKYRKKGEFRKLVRKLWEQLFFIYAEAPLGRVERVVEYLGQYVYKVAISPWRIEEVDEEKVRIRYKDNRDGGKEKRMWLGGAEFVRRYLAHILPKGYKKVRYYGLFSNRARKGKLEEARRQIGIEEEDEAEGYAEKCPECGKGKMRVVEVVYGRRDLPRERIWMDSS
jgi:hypothetical protein